MFNEKAFKHETAVKLRRATGRGWDVKALSHLDDLASVCRFMNFFSKTLAHVEYVMGKFCIR